MMPLVPAVGRGVGKEGERQAEGEDRFGTCRRSARGKDAADERRTNDGLDEHGRDGVGVLLTDGELKVLKQTSAMGGIVVLRATEGAAVREGVADADEAGNLAGAPTAVVAGAVEGEVGGTVVGTAAHDDLVALGVETGHTDGVLVGLGTAEAEEVVGVGRGHLLHLEASAGAPLGGPARGKVVNVLHGLVDGLDNTGVSVTGVGAHEAGIAIEELAALVVNVVVTLLLHANGRVPRLLGTPAHDGVVLNSGTDLVRGDGVPNKRGLLEGLNGATEKH